MSTKPKQSGYIYIPNWDRFQHYKNRRPAWIKMYLDLLDKDEYLNLSFADRGLLHDIWKLTSIVGNGRLTCSRVSLQRRLNVRRVSLEPLINAGFIEIRASKALADPLATETETEKRKKEQAPSSEVLPGAPASTNGHGTAVETISGEDADLARWQASLIIRTDPIGRLAAEIGSSCDKHTEAVIRNTGATEAEIHRARESLERAIPRPGNPAGFVVNALKSMVAERGAHLAPVPTRRETA